IIDFLISQHPIARVLREHLVFKIAPMLNPDGVYLGNYRCSLMGFDLNRHWLDPSPWAHPTLHGVKQLIIQMYNDPGSPGFLVPCLPLSKAFLLKGSPFLSIPSATEDIMGSSPTSALHRVSPSSSNVPYECYASPPGNYTKTPPLPASPSSRHQGEFRLCLETPFTNGLAVSSRQRALRVLGAAHCGQVFRPRLLICFPFSHQKTSLEFYIDIHAHSTMMNGFMYGNIFEDEERFQRQAVFPKLLCQNAEDFSYSSTSFNRDAVKAGTGRRFLGGLLDHTSYCYTLEVSFYSYIIGGTTAAVPYTEEASSFPISLCGASSLPHFPASHAAFLQAILVTGLTGHLYRVLSPSPVCVKSGVERHMRLDAERKDRVNVEWLRLLWELQEGCSLTYTLADMKLGRNVAKTFLDYYRLNPVVEKVAIPMPRLRKEKPPPYKHPLLRGPAGNYPNGKGDKKSSVHHKDPSNSF
ncbi:Cytosolic carboxypeptidase 6, partial [Galemys pyrenaicus]